MLTDPYHPGPDYQKRKDSRCPGSPFLAKTPKVKNLLPPFPPPPQNEHIAAMRY